MPTDDAETASSLGQTLLLAVRNLWKATNSQGADIALIQQRLAALESEVQGLKISRGRAKAKSARLEAALTESEQKMSEIRSRLN